MHATHHGSFADYRHGIRDNLAQFLHQLVQVFLVGTAGSQTELLRDFFMLITFNIV